MESQRAGLLRVVICGADFGTEELISSLITRKIPGMVLHRSLRNLEKLFRFLENNNPEIIVADADALPFDLLKETIAKYNGASFLLLSAKREFDLLYAALKSGAADFCLKPLDPSELTESLKKCASARRNDSLWSSWNPKRLRRLFIDKKHWKDVSHWQSIEEANKEFGTSFKKGLYRMFFVKIDTVEPYSQYYSRSETLNKETETTIETFLKALVYEMVFRRLNDGVVALINYPDKNEKEVSAVFSPLFEKISKYAGKKNVRWITLLVSSQRNDILFMSEMNEELFIASWMRYFRGKERIIFFEKPAKELDYVYKQKFHSVFFAVKKALEILDAAEFRRCMEDFFTLPDNIVSRMESRLFLQELRDLVFQMTKKIMPSENENFEEEVLFALHVQDALEKYKKTFIEKLYEMISDSAKYLRKQLSNEVRQAVVHVQDNYGKSIYIEEVAKKVCLSTNYFSALFKKEMAQSFVNYLINYRIMVAKRILRNSDLNVTEVASAVGYDDARYFGRLFKKYVGMRPNEYRHFFR
jgi:two-component system response regulator YesN